MKCNKTLKIISFFLGIIFLFADTCFLKNMWKEYSVAVRMKKTAVETPVDLSKPGCYEIQVPAILHYLHFPGAIVVVYSDIDYVSKNDAQKLLEGLKGKIVNTDENGQVLKEINFTDDDFFYVLSIKDSSRKTLFQIKGFSLESRKPTQLSFTITHGATKLKDAEQTLVVRYHKVIVSTRSLLTSMIIGVVLAIIGFSLIILPFVRISKRIEKQCV